MIPGLKESYLLLADSKDFLVKFRKTFMKSLSLFPPTFGHRLEKNVADQKTQNVLWETKMSSVGSEEFKIATM